jgi:hypothetical protein
VLPVPEGITMGDQPPPPPQPPPQPLLLLTFVTVFLGIGSSFNTTSFTVHTSFA